MPTVLICKTKSGEWKSVVSESKTAMLERAKEVRISGVLDDMPIEGGIVINDERYVKRFRCENVGAVEAKAKKRKSFA